MKIFRENKFIDTKINNKNKKEQFDSFPNLHWMEMPDGPLISKSLKMQYKKNSLKNVINFVSKI